MLNGQISDVKIVDRALTDEELKQIHENLWPTPLKPGIILPPEPIDPPRPPGGFKEVA